MKRTAALVLALCLLVTPLLSGCLAEEDPWAFPLKEKVKYTFAQARTESSKPYQMLTEWNKKYEELSNIEIEWLDWGVAESYVQKLNLSFASGDMPDALYGGWVIGGTDYVNYGSQGLLVTIEDKYEEYMPNFAQYVAKKPEFLSSLMTPEGHVYGLPAYNEDGGADTNDTILYNSDWMEKLGLTVPTTTDEFYAYLKAIKEAGDLNENGKNDEIPFTFKFGSHTRGISSFIGFSGVVLPSSWYVIQDGKALFAPAQPGFKEAMQFLHKLSADGLIDKEAFTMDDAAYLAKIRNAEPNVGVCIAWSIAETNRALERDVFINGPALKGNDGDPLWVRRFMNINTNMAFVVTSAAKNPELLLKWADLHFDFDNSVQNRYGPYDKYIRKLGNGEFEEILKPDGTQYTDEKNADAPLNFSLYIIQKDDFRFNKLSQDALEKQAADALYAPYLQKEYYNPNVYLSVEESRKIDDIAPDITEYVKKCMANWIYKGGVEEEWDAYLLQLEKLQLNTWVDSVQAIYDRTGK